MAFHVMTQNQHIPIRSYDGASGPNDTENHYPLHSIHRDGNVDADPAAAAMLSELNAADPDKRRGSRPESPSSPGGRRNLKNQREQQRRKKINDRFTILSELLFGSERVDKAQILDKAIQLVHEVASGGLRKTEIYLPCDVASSNMPVSGIPGSGIPVETVPPRPQEAPRTNRPLHIDTSYTKRPSNPTSTSNSASPSYSARTNEAHTPSQTNKRRYSPEPISKHEEDAERLHEHDASAEDAQAAAANLTDHREHSSLDTLVQMFQLAETMSKNKQRGTKKVKLAAE